MSSSEVFANNIKIVLEEKGWRVRDLAEKTGISESYLSLVLNGTRRNIRDDYKDRIATALGVSVSSLFSESFPYDHVVTPNFTFSNHNRKELIDTLDLLLTRTGLEQYRMAFRASCGVLDDAEAEAVRRFVSEVLKNVDYLGVRGQLPTSIPENETKILAFCHMAGSGARLEWIQALTDMDRNELLRIMNSLQATGLLRVLEETTTTRIFLDQSFPPLPLSSMFTQKEITGAYLTLARVMQTFRDEGAEFEARLGDVLAKAGRYREAQGHWKNAAGILETNALWQPAAENWQKAAVANGILNDSTGKIRCLCEAAKCVAEIGDWELAESLGKSALKSAKNHAYSSLMLANVCTAMGNCYYTHDLPEAIAWYQEGLSHCNVSLQVYGHLLRNLASAYLKFGKIDESEKRLEQLLNWNASYGRHLKDINLESDTLLLKALIHYKKREWSKAEEVFLSFITDNKGNSPVDRAVALHGLGVLTYLKDETGKSREFLKEAARTFDSHGLHRESFDANVDLAKTEIREGNLDEAARLLAGTGNYPFEEGWRSLLVACIEEASGHIRKAIEKAKSAVDIFNAQGSTADLACAALWLSRRLAIIGNAEKARFYENWAFDLYSKKRWDIRDLHRQCSLLMPRIQETNTNRMLL